MVHLAERRRDAYYERNPTTPPHRHKYLIVAAPWKSLAAVAVESLEQSPKTKSIDACDLFAFHAPVKLRNVTRRYWRSFDVELGLRTAQYLHEPFDVDIAVDVWTERKPAY